MGDIKDTADLYLSPDGQPQLQNSLYVFLDALGFKQEILTAAAKGNAQEHLQRFHQAITDASQYLKPLDLGFDTPPTWRTSTFTDNIALGHPINPSYGDMGESAYGAVLDMITRYQITMVKHGFFVRGGWSVGDLFMDNSTVYGAAVIEAYDLESTHAVHPKIVLSRGVLRLVFDQSEFSGGVKTAPHQYEILTGRDGRPFLNYLWTLLDDCEVDEGAVEFLTFFLQRHKQQVVQRLQEHKSIDRVFQKYRWVADYHNFFCSEFLKKEFRKFTIDTEIDESFAPLDPSHDPRPEEERGWDHVALRAIKHEFKATQKQSKPRKKSPPKT